MTANIVYARRTDVENVRFLESLLARCLVSLEMNRFDMTAGEASLMEFGRDYAVRELQALDHDDVVRLVFGALEDALTIKRGERVEN